MYASIYTYLAGMLNTETVEKQILKRQMFS